MRQGGFQDNGKCDVMERRTGGRKKKVEKKIE